MQLGYVISADRGALDPLLSRFAAQTMADGAVLAGAVQSNYDCPGRHRCDMELLLLPDGPSIRISQNLGQHARGCVLNPEALEQAVAETARRITPDTELLVINKFGKHEAQGHGFRDLIAEALARGIPVLVGVNSLNLDEFLDFAGDLGQQVQPEIPALIDWLRATRNSAM